jgi:hypothetical protein
VIGEFCENEVGGCYKHVHVLCCYEHDQTEYKESGTGHQTMHKAHKLTQISYIVR